ncbi:MAG: hypothetical protein JNJ40_05785 [Bacteroidia bacterium]|nr:hypothetical protein [Bacteroidia bacterium]
MRSLSKILYTGNVLFSYYGFIDSSVLTQVLNITKSKLEGNKENEVVIQRVYNAINECVDNIIKHNFFPDDALLHYKSLLLISMGEKSYLVDTINVVNALQKQAIIEKLNFLNSKSKTELLTLKSQIMMEGRVADVTPEGLGMIDLILKTNDFNFHFKEYGENFLFSINFKINTTS